MNFLCRNLCLSLFAAATLLCSNLAAQPHLSSSLDWYVHFIPNYSNMTLDFEDVTSTNLNNANEPVSNNEKEIEFGDYDNDGDLDVLMAVALSDFGERNNKLYRNDNGVFNEVSGSVIPGFTTPDVGRSAFFRDFDDDGWLDIVIVCDQNSCSFGPGTCQNNGENQGRTKYYRNVNGTSFVNESLTRIPTGGMGAACNGTAEDFDNDGDCDFLMCNYPNVSQDTLYINNGSGVFTNMTNSLYPFEFDYGVHSEAADMNGDGKLDILMANWSGDDSFIYYNNNGGGSGVGDFRYNGAGAMTQFNQGGGTGEIAMVPGDFNNDGLMDFYYTNKGGSHGSRTDVVMVNAGNDGNNKATFTQYEMPSTQNNETHKVTVNDLDGDGFLDLIIMDEVRRPYIYRNTSVDGGAVSFVQWTPTTFSGSSLRGWQAKSDQLLGDNRPDIFLGAYNDDFLYENVPSTEYLESSLSNGALPDFHNTSPIAVLGAAETNQTEVFTRSIPAGANVSVIIRSAGDVTIEAYTSGGSQLAISDNSFMHGTEGIEFTSPGGTIEFRVTMNRVIYDGDADGDIDATDMQLFKQVIMDPNFLLNDRKVYDLSNSFGETAFDGVLLRRRMNAPTAEEFYCVEFLSRTN